MAKYNGKILTIVHMFHEGKYREVNKNQNDDNEDDQIKEKRFEE